MLEIVFTARSLQPPRDSMTSGTKDTPTDWQCEACIVIFSVPDLAYKSAAAYVEHAFARPMLASY